MSPPEPSMLAGKCQQKKGPKFCFCLVGATTVKMHILKKKNKLHTVALKANWISDTTHNLFPLYCISYHV